MLSVLLYIQLVTNPHTCGFPAQGYKCDCILLFWTHLWSSCLASSMLINHTWTLHGGPVRWDDCFPGLFTQWPYWGILQLNPHTAMLFSPFWRVYQPTSLRPILSAHTEPISQKHCWKWYHAQIAWHIHAIAVWWVMQTLEVWA